MKKAIFSISFFIAVSKALAQQLPVWNGAAYNKFLINPAVAGSELYIDARLQHRSQWVGIGSSPTTQTLSVHSSIDDVNLGVGGYMFNDKTGVLSNTGGALAAAYHLPLGETTKLAFGLSGSFGRYRLLMDQIVLAHENDNLLQTANTVGRGVFNMQSGFYLYSERYYVGASAHHLFNQKLEYTFSSTTPQIQHYYALGGVLLPVGQSIVIEPAFQLNYIQNNPFHWLGMLKADYNELIQFGLGYRSSNMAVLATGIYPFPQFGINYYYDLAFSSLGRVSTGSHEIALNVIIYYKEAYKKAKRRYKWLDVREGKKQSKPIEKPEED